MTYATVHSSTDMKSHGVERANSAEAAVDGTKRWPCWGSCPNEQGNTHESQAQLLEVQVGHQYTPPSRG